MRRKERSELAQTNMLYRCLLYRSMSVIIKETVEFYAPIQLILIFTFFNKGWNKEHIIGVSDIWESGETSQAQYNNQLYFVIAIAAAEIILSAFWVHLVKRIFGINLISLLGFMLKRYYYLFLASQGFILAVVLIISLPHCGTDTTLKFSWLDKE